jgi:flagellar biosynthesis/type III secretory pathway protein FliH
VTSFSSVEWEAYERAKMAEQDAHGALAVAHQEGTRPGLSRGHKTGLAEGHKTGLAEGHKTGLVEGKRDVLLRLLARRGSRSQTTRARGSLRARIPRPSIGGSTTR